MKTAKANKHIETLIKRVKAEGIDAQELILELQTLREHAITEKDPLIVRSIRMAYQHLEQHDGWVFPIIKMDSEEEEESETYDVEAPGEDHFCYLLNLWLKSDNKYNRDETREIANKLNQF
jgi:hypothetical protein